MTSSLQFILGDLEEPRFLADHYGQTPVLLPGYAGKFSQIFSLSDLNEILNFSELHYPRVRVTDHQNTIHKYDLIDDKNRYSNNINNELNRKKVLLAIARGGTLVFDRIQEHHRKLEVFVDELRGQIRTHVSMNAYYTARRQLGVNAHFDRHDVFAIQIHGSKRWFYRNDSHVLSKSIRHQQVPEVDANFTGWSSVLVEEGDVFYCPRGVWHFTQTEDQHSAHLAMGLYPLTLGDWLRQLEEKPEVADLLEEYIQQPSQHDDRFTDITHLERLIALMRTAADQPVASVRSPRPYLELE
ncbi:cupin domain-containing protein [Paraburkholderia sp. SIMBA_049]